MSRSRFCKSFSLKFCINSEFRQILSLCHCKVLLFKRSFLLILYFSGGGARGLLPPVYATGYTHTSESNVLFHPNVLTGLLQILQMSESQPSCLYYTLCMAAHTPTDTQFL